MSDRARTPELVLLALVAALVAGGLLLGGGDGGSSHAARTAEQISPARIALVERRVERLRGLRFRRRVPVQVISPAQARRYGVAEERRVAQPAREQGAIEVEKLLGLLAPDVDVAKVTSAIYGEQVAGFYDTHRKRLMLVRGAGVDEVTLAHELTHALEDQHFDLEHLAGRSRAQRSDDATGAYTALVEGTATELMLRYMLRYPDAAPSLGDALGSLGTSGGTLLPPYVMRSLLFPYLQGQEFVAALRHGSAGWALVNVALRYRPPVSTAEVIDPDRWLRVQRPVPVQAARLGVASLGRGWRRAVGSTFGQFETTQLLYATSGSSAAERIARGWTGGRYELWRRGGWEGSVDCAAPCRERDALAVAWRVRSTRAAAALAGGLRRWLRSGLDARSQGHRDDGWRLPGGSAAAVRVRGLDVRVALAPTAPLASTLVR